MDGPEKQSSFSVVSKSNIAIMASQDVILPNDCPNYEKNLNTIMSACLNGHLVITKKSLCLDSQFVLLQ